MEVGCSLTAHTDLSTHRLLVTSDTLILKNSSLSVTLAVEFPSSHIPALQGSGHQPGSLTVLVPREQFAKGTVPILFSLKRWEMCPKRLLDLTTEGTREMGKKVLQVRI